MTTTRWLLGPLMGLALAAAAAAQVPGDFGFGLGAGRVTIDAKFADAPARPGELITLEVGLSIERGYHLYGSDEVDSIPTTLAFPKLGGLEPVGPAKIPGGKRVEKYGLVSYYLGDSTLVQVFRVPEGMAPGTVEVQGELAYMACTEETCDDPTSDLFTAKLEIEAGPAREDRTAVAMDPGEATTDPVAPPTGSQPPPNDDLGSMPLGLFLLLAIGGGLFALAMPCTYPMIPITISFFTKQAAARGGNVLPLALTYGAGIIGIFVAVGAAVGPAIVPFASHWLTNAVIAVLFLVFALSLFGLINLQPPQFLMNAASQASGRGGIVGVFLMGATLVVTSFTCTAPFVGSLLAVGVEQGLGRVVLGMAVFGATMALPFVFLSLLPGKLSAMPRSGEWMNVLKVFLGFVEVAAALKFISNVDLVRGWGILPRELFLVSWAGIFALSGVFLLGMIKLKGETGEIGPGRLVGALAVFLLAIYLGFGSTGRPLDRITDAIAPPYSVAALGGGLSTAHATSHDIVVDDYRTALAQAKEKHRKVLVNFTGVT